MQSFKIKFILIAIVFSFTVQSFAQDYVFTSVNIIDMASEQILKNHYIHVKSGKIHAINPEINGLPTDKDVIVIDGDGAFVFPGLAEMHSHIPVTNSDDFSYLQDVMWLYLANGVLNVRGMIGHSSHLVLKDKIKNGEITGPRIFAAGPSLNGDSVEDAEAGNRMVREQAEAGYDHLKLHPGLDMPKFMAISTTAKAKGIKFGGHVSLDVGLENSILNGYRSIEHMDGYIEYLIDDKSKLDPQIAGPFSMLLAKEANMERLPKIIELTLAQGAWIAPTLTLFERFFGYIPADEFRLASEMKYMPGLQVQQWVNQKKMLEGQGLLKEENVKPYLEFRKKLLMALHENGVPIIMSSDSPQVFNVPGFSIHHEIAALSDAGMSNYEILKSGSVNVAKYFEMEGEFGQIIPGASADFVMLDGNPLENLDALKKIQSIMLRGEWIQKNKLEAELERLEIKNLRK
ncbi:amidohydrolase, imidazolonepropionase [Belliella baltica DSM 15883]|uniref:Amidohydrolase, imidazolonepropionase n=1 Tax=Belliella baltica (strain DSM 15883 / CIP 108006 / LMG 21964 / BA134) TaxID=866536 RepID=I3ZAH7_BELBD|nr:amidohydrolase family protein [Belliella baltica]AFL86245.1 amidohydrolase, imidazolonepropionase [Belliella baltica DSM 15883]